MNRPFAGARAHLDAVGETYLEHMRYAASVGLALIVAGLACLVHAFNPAWFETTASRTIRRLAAALENRELAPRPRGGALALLLPLSGAAAALPWLAGADTSVAAAVSLLAIAYPLAFLYAEAGSGAEAAWA
jgi:hypothetical protein